MTRRIELKGAKIAMAGRFTGWGYERKIEEGGELTHIISAKLTCFVAGPRAGGEAARAAARWRRSPGSATCASCGWTHATPGLMRRGEVMRRSGSTRCWS